MEIVGEDSMFFQNNPQLDVFLKIAMEDNLAALKDFHDRHPTIHWSFIKQKSSGDTILHIAARFGNLSIVKYALENYKKFNVDITSNVGKTALHEAAQFGRFEIMKLLIENGANVNAITGNEFTITMSAVLKQSPNMYEILDYLILHGAMLNIRNRDGWTVLHLTARLGEYNIFELLLDHQIDIYPKTYNGRSALHIASLHGHFEIAKKLIDLGLDVNEMDQCGNTPLFEAILGGKNMQLCQFFVERTNNSLSNINNVGYNLLHLASMGGDFAMVNYILKDLEFNPNLSTPTGITPLHCAGRRKHLDTYRLLLEFGADEALQDNFQRTAKDYLNMA